MNVTLEKIKEMTGSNTIIGEPIRVDGATILPVSKVTFGFAGGGSGAGVSVTPVAFLIIKDGNVRTVQLADPASTVDRALNMLPELVDKLGGMLAKKEDAAPSEQEP